MQTIKEQREKLDQLEECLLSHQTLLEAQAEKIKDQEAKLIDLNRKMLESEQKMNEFQASGPAGLSDSLLAEKQANKFPTKNRKRSQDFDSSSSSGVPKKFKK